jgi:ribosome-binding factor A
MAEVKRAARVSERVRESLGKLFNSEVRDPRLSGVIVSRVQMADDLRSTKVYFRFLTGDATAQRRKEAQTGLERAAPMLRSEVTKEVGLRFAPELRFYYDEGLDKENRIDQLLEEVKRDAKPRDPA